MVVFDTTTLLVALAPPASVPVVVDGRSIDDARERVDHLISELEGERTKIIIPTPALSEALARSDASAAQAYVDRIARQAGFSIEHFDTIAALEAAAMTHEALQTGDKRGGASGHYQKIKVVRQIVAIAKVHGADTIFSNDAGLRTLAERAGLRVTGIEELGLPEPPRQGDWLRSSPLPQDGGLTR